MLPYFEIRHLISGVKITLGAGCINVSRPVLRWAGTAGWEKPLAFCSSPGLFVQWWGINWGSWLHLLRGSEGLHDVSLMSFTT